MKQLTVALGVTLFLLTILSILNSDRRNKAKIALDTTVSENVKLKKELIDCKTCPYVYLDTTRILYEFEQFDMDTSLVYIMGSYKNTIPGLAPGCVYRVGQGVTNWVGPRLPIFEKYTYIPDQFLKIK